MSKSRTSFERISTTQSSEIRALELLVHIQRLEQSRPVIAIAGESGSGKSTTATSLQLELQKVGSRAVLLHLDNYFKEIPRVNDRLRREDFGTVGVSEIDIPLLQSHIHAFKVGEESILIPVLTADRREFIKIQLNLSEVDILIVEGTYALALDEIDLKIFLSLDYEKSRDRRIARGRDVVDDFSEKVLKKEHTLIQPYSSVADIIIDEDGRICVNDQGEC